MKNNGGTKGKIIGTIVTVKEYLSNEEVPVTINKGYQEEHVFTLEKNRRYIIPDYQREIRWNKENIVELMVDISSRDKFLGNIILAKKDNDYYLIDGQQRTTIFLMLITYIRHFYGSQINVFDTCDLINDSFSGLSELFKNNFIESSKDYERSKIDQSDYYKQKDHYLRIWEEIKNTKILKDRYAAESFLTNLKNCELNIITNTDKELESSISYFLDVNLKGVKLDNEDIFKGYLFAKDLSSDIRNLWRDLKHKCMVLEENGVKYDILSIIHQYMACTLYKYDNGKFKSFKFDKQFLLSDFKSDRSCYYKGQHLINVVNDKKFMRDSINNINEYLDIIVDIVSNTDQTMIFKNNFYRLNDVERQVVFILIKIIIKDNNIIPKVILMKYIFEIKDNNFKDKEKLKKIYAVFSIYTIFNIFENKKSRDKLYEIVERDDWYKEILVQINDYFSAESLTKTQILIAYRYTMNDENVDEKYRCKSLAALYNYFHFKNDIITVDNVKSLKNFLKNDETYSIEHFIISNSKKKNTIKIGTEEYKIPNNIAKYKNSLFNFIFIENEINTSLENYNVYRKIEKLKKYDFKCEYSKMVYELLSDIVQNNEEIKSIVNNPNNDNLDEFFENEFASIYMEYANKVISKVVNKFKL